MHTDMNMAGRLALSLLLALGFAQGVFAQAAAPALVVEPEISFEGPVLARQKGKGRASHAHPVILSTPTPEELAQLEPPGKRGRPPQVGFARRVQALERDLGDVLSWEVSGDKRVAAVSLSSPEAASLRLGLRVDALPADAILRIHDLQGEELFEVGASEVLQVIEANRAAGDRTPEGRTWWSPVIESATAVLEIEVPASASLSSVRVSIPAVSHLVTSARTDFVVPKAAAACNLDATCQLGAWSAQMNAVSRMVFTSGGSSYVCTGTLLADTDAASTIPYFLTANHCIDSQTVANSLANYWFFRSSACNGSNPGPYVQQSAGAGTQLLYNSTATDVSFIRLGATPPAGVTYAGWKSSPGLTMGAAVTGLHHPTGDLLKISGGSVADYLACSAPTNGQFSCNSATNGASAYYGVTWSSGIVQGGSSGSALFDGGKFVVGQLYGGSSSCTNPAAGDIYGRFDRSFAAALSQYLDPPTPPQQLTVTRAGAGSGTVASAPSGINCGSTCSASFPAGSTVTLTATPAQGSTFGGWSGACTGTAACTVAMSAARAVTATFNRDFGVAVSTGSLIFGSTQSSQTVTYTNNTGAKVTFIQASTTSARFGQTNNCGEVAAGASCTATVTYSPTNAGPDSGIFTMTSTASNSAHVVSLWAAGAQTPRLTNLSTRMQVLTGADVMIGGFVVGGSTPKTVVLRARGPSLVAYGIYNALGNPHMRLVRSSDGATVAENNDWQAAANAAAVSASGFAPDHPLDAAILVTLPPGAYTAVVSGIASTGVAIFEVFELDHPEVPLANISTRGQVRTGNDAMIGGFVVTGNAPRTVVVRARGPSLVPFGVADALSNPMLQLVRSSDGAVITQNDDFGTAPNLAQLQATGFAPGNALESAILITLQPGAYTAIVTGVGGATGVGIVEVFAQ